ncbi:MAG TPA: acetyl-CoA carboxylase biotin carboxyl carrier protein [Planctomycetaceae bacterium]|nr:acetyl-CoA carboxylase biotin carboxyl carrier protein [Planctomycetaceae bacterium]
MSDADKPQDAPFDFDKLVQLVKLMETHGLTEVSLRRGDQKWTLRRGLDPSALALHGAEAVRQPSVATRPPDAAESQPVTPPADGTITINSPTVGTFYSAASPDDSPFVSIGSRVNPETVVCIVEAMKVFNQIPAEVSGTIVEVLVKNGDSVEFGQPLFRVRPG